MKKQPTTYITFYATGAFNHFLKISHKDSTELIPQHAFCFQSVFQKTNVHVLFFSLSWWLASVQYTDSTETAVVAFLFSVSRTLVCAFFLFDWTVCLNSLKAFSSLSTGLISKTYSKCAIYLQKWYGILLLMEYTTRFWIL